MQALGDLFARGNWLLFGGGLRRVSGGAHGWPGASTLSFRAGLVFPSLAGKERHPQNCRNKQRNRRRRSATLVHSESDLARRVRSFVVAATNYRWLGEAPLNRANHLICN